MQIVLEGEENDKKLRLESSRFFSKFFSYVCKQQNWKKILAKGVTIGEDITAYEIAAKNVDPKYKNLVILLSSPMKGIHGGFGVQGNKQYIVLPVLRNEGSMTGVPDNVLKYESTFIHEFTHFLDQQRWKGGKKDFATMQQRGGSSIGKDPKDYYNHPLETNAYYQQAIKGLIRAIARAMRDKQTQRIKYYIPNNVNQFVQNVQRSYLRPEFVRSLDPENTRKLHKRLASLYIRLQKSKKNYEAHLGNKL
jgi:hypothetical protein